MNCAKIEIDPATGDLIVPIPDSILEQLGWTVNDELSWSLGKNNELILTLKKIKA